MNIKLGIFELKNLYLKKKVGLGSFFSSVCIFVLGFFLVCIFLFGWGLFVVAVSFSEHNDHMALHRNNFGAKCLYQLCSSQMFFEMLPILRLSYS